MQVTMTKNTPANTIQPMPLRAPPPALGAATAQPAAASRLALPPAAVVLIDSTRSMAKA